MVDWWVLAVEVGRGKMAGEDHIHGRHFILFLFMFGRQWSRNFDRESYEDEAGRADVLLEKENMWYEALALLLLLLMVSERV